MTRRLQVPQHATSPFDPLDAFDPVDAAGARHTGDVWLVDALRVHPPSWVEAVLIVQAVCARLGPMQMPPMIADLALTPQGEVRFPPGGVADHREALATVWRLFDRLIDGQACPIGVWNARDAARPGARTLRTPFEFSAALQSLVPTGGSSLLAAYVADTQDRLAASTSRAPNAAPWFLQPR